MAFARKFINEARYDGWARSRSRFNWPALQSVVVHCILLVNLSFCTTLLMVPRLGDLAGSCPLAESGDIGVFSKGHHSFQVPRHPGLSRNLDS